ncbi:4-hydroxy-tetrahydrodipicolinate synthase [Pigmentiphaga aceris]|uniref:4-hydroxy-tetrahydrodipicolinate synthase n=1 Tax=Pigmentiphaga aceris TaxID=1940612 RepID=A0A5C0AYQ9_9BURK|nr:4-hydroxy-tetrahydrodipicolinate synthase [Pigmentiphaga aceris]QEI07498.1 4-hydroxy-tetrahydrodipicolinate synthase [Pigmentiphaga aceris]
MTEVFPTRPAPASTTSADSEASRSSLPCKAERAQFTGIWLPMITPMRHGKVDMDAAVQLADHYRRAGITGLVLFGSTGEGNLLSTAEKLAMVQAVQTLPDALPIVVGMGGVDTRKVCDDIRRLDRLNLAGYLVPPPYYLRPSADGIAWHYHQLARATQRPLMLYNVPRRTGVAMDVATLETLARDPQFAAVKECDPDMLDTLVRRNAIPVLCGEDDAFLDHALRGGQGAIPVVAHVFPQRMVEVMRLAHAGQADTARSLFDPLRPLIRLLFEEPSPAPVKKLLASQGWIADELRLPMTPASDALAARIDKAMLRIDAPSTERQRAASTLFSQ